MHYREHSLLGSKVSVIGFGGAALSGEGGGYGFGDMSEEKAEKLIHSAWDMGINVFDSAPIYGFGLSEERLGKYLHKDALIVTKGGVDWHSTKRVNMSNDPKIIEKMLLESLKRLKRDQIHLYMIHWPDKNVDIRRPLEVLAKYQQKGAIGEIGLCNTNLTDLKLAQDVVKISALQSELNALNTNAFDDLGDEWKKYFTMSWGTFDKGILTGRVHSERKYDKSDARSWAPWWNKKEVQEKVAKVAQLKQLLLKHDYSLDQFCLSFNLFYYEINQSLVGVKSLEDLVQLTSNLQKIIPRENIHTILQQWNNYGTKSNDS